MSRLGRLEPGGPADPAPRRRRAPGEPGRPGARRDRRRALPAGFGSVTGWRGPGCHPGSCPPLHGQAATRAADLKSHQQVISISESALEIADSDEARAPFWEMVIEASGRLADLESTERHAAPAMDHYRNTGDQVSLTRVTRKFALGLGREQPARTGGRVASALGRRRPRLGSGARPGGGRVCPRPDAEPDARSARGGGPGPCRSRRSSGWMPETIDALITKGTVPGAVGRLSEARIILEGAIALAEEHDLGRSIARGQNNLAYVLFGLDDAASLAVGEDAYRTAQRLGDRSLLLFQVGQMAFASRISGSSRRRRKSSPTRSPGTNPRRLGSTPQTPSWSWRLGEETSTGSDGSTRR